MTFSATATVFAIAHRFVWRERDAGVAPNSLVDGSWRLGILACIKSASKFELL